MDFESLLEKYKVQIGIGLVGLILIGVGVFLVRQLAEETTVEILSTEENAESSATIFVDLEGAVQKPGVYELNSNARINDLLIRAGGLSAEADREWVAANLNLAQKLADGVKIYIPERSEFPLRPAGGPAGGGVGAQQVAGASASVTGQININTASASQLESLWGIGVKRAQDIIDNRPFQSIEELKTKASIPSNVYERIKEEITVY